MGCDMHANGIAMHSFLGTKWSTGYECSAALKRKLITIE